MSVVKDTEMTIAAVLPAELEGFSKDNDFCSSLADALVRGWIRMAGGEAIDVACFVTANPSRGAINDLAAIAPRWSGSALPVVISPSPLSESKQQALRNAELAFFDASGNAWLETPGIFVDRRGMAASLDWTDQKPARPAAGIFSDKATIVSRMLLQGQPLGIRELSDAASDAGFALSSGFVSKVAGSLERKRYAKRSDGKMVLSNHEGLLADWSDAYRRMHHPRPRGWYLHAADASSTRDTVGQLIEGHGALAGLAAASVSDGFAMFDVVDVYARNLPAVETALETAGALRVDRGANVNVSVPKYKVSAFFGLQSRNGINITSDLQTFLDLQLQPRRGREAAEHLMETRLKHLSEGNWAEGDGA